MRAVWWFVLVACGAPPHAAPPPAAPKLVAVEPSEPTGMPEGYVELHAARVVPVGDGTGALLLTDESMDIVLPIFIGGTEAASIEGRLDGLKPERPLTHDLWDATLHELHATLVKVQVDDIRDGIFIGSVYIRTATRVLKIDARPSDAVALAIGNKVPIYVAKSVLDTAGIKRDDLQQQLGTGHPKPIAS